MDAKYADAVANYLNELDMFPYFNICHYLMISLHMRQIAPGNKAFSRQHPLASWLATMLMCFSGSFISNFLIGEPLIIPLKYHENIIHASLCWYLMNYFPFDLVFKICSFVPVYLVISLAKELYRAKMVHIGIAVAAKRFPDSFLVWLSVGLAKGCGEDMFLPIAYSCMGGCEGAGNFLLNPTFNVKGSLAVAVMFGMEKLQKVPLGSSQIFLAAVIFLIYFRVSSILVGIKDPFLPFETLICGVLFGGFMETLKEMKEKQAAERKKRYTDVNNLPPNSPDEKGDTDKNETENDDSFSDKNLETESDYHEGSKKED